MRTVGALLARPRFRSLMIAQLLARAPIGLWPIGMLLLVEERTGSYAAAGLVAAMMTAGRAVGTPVVSRAVDRWGLRRVIGATAAGSSLAGIALAVLPAGASPATGTLVLTNALALVSGLLNPPVQPAVRALLPAMVSPEQRAGAFAVDASAQEIIFVFGPLLAFGISNAAGPAWAIVTGAALQLVGAVGVLVASGGAVVPRAEPEPSRGRRSVLREPAILAGAAVSLLLVAANSAVEAAVAAEFGGHGLTGGVLLAAYSLASLAGGLLFARWTSDRWAQARWLALVALGLALASAWLDPAWLGASLVVAGLGVAPVFASVAGRVSAASPAARATEAFGWVDSGAIIGASVGFAAAGAVIGTGGVAQALVLSAALAVAAALLAAATRGRVDGPATSRGGAVRSG